MTTDDLLDDLRTLAPAPDPAPLSASARDRLEVAFVDAASPRRPWRTLAPAALVAACVLAVAALVALPFVTDSPDAAAPLPVRAEPAAVRALDTLATVALTTSTPTVRPDEFVYVRSTAITNEGTLGGGVELGAPHEREIWLSQEPSTDEQGLIREFGQDWPLGGSGRAVPAGPERPTYEWIAGLPADPDRILTELASHQPVGSEQSSDQYVFERIGDLITEGLVPPDLAGALFEAVTKIPGVELVAHAEDAIGRAGFGISRTDEVFGTTTLWVFRPGSPAPLGVRWYADGGTLFGATAVLERGVAERLGVAPGELAT